VGRPQPGVCSTMGVDDHVADAEDQCHPAMAGSRLGCSGPRRDRCRAREDGLDHDHPWRTSGYLEPCHRQRRARRVAQRMAQHHRAFSSRPWPRAVGRTRTTSTLRASHAARADGRRPARADHVAGMTGAHAVPGDRRLAVEEAPSMTILPGRPGGALAYPVSPVPGSRVQVAADPQNLSRASRKTGPRPGEEQRAEGARAPNGPPTPARR